MVSFHSAVRRAFYARIIVAALAVVFVMTSSMLPSLAAGGQTGNLQGTLIDAQTKSPLSNAAVTAVAPSGRYATHTDAHGNFQIVGMIVDTYTISASLTGYQPLVLQGITIGGDSTVNVSTQTLTRSLAIIGKTTARSQSSVYQPNQTVDSYTISGDRMLQTTGKAASTNENDLALAAPGVTLTNTGGLTIRGGLRTEVGYQLDGVDFTEPFFSQNGSNGHYNGIGSVQIVEGAGDASQGNVGGGVVNLVPKRGTLPAFGLVDLEAGGPNYQHQFAFEYGFATPNGRISDYVAYNGQRDAPYNGYSNANAAAYGNYFGISSEKNDQFLNNFIYKFGKDKSQSIQILYVNQDLVQYGNLGGTFTGPNRTQFYTNDPTNPVAADFFPSQASYASLIGLNHDIPGNGSGVPTGPLEATWNPTRYLKFEYDNNINASTFLQARYYNWETLQGNSNDTGSAAISSGLGLGTYPAWNETGGPRVGFTLDLTKQLGSKSTLTLSGKYEDAHPIWNGDDPNALAFLLGAAAPGSGPTLADFLPGGYLAQFFPGGVPRIPDSGIDYNGANFQTFGVGLRWQYNPSDHLKFDIGLRSDGQNQHYGINPFNPLEPGNPSDVDPATITSKFLDPRELEPRFAMNYIPDRTDAYRFGYGRSVVFLNSQTAGTPAGLFGGGSFTNVPALPGFTCGSGHNGVLPCQNYAQELYWLYDQNFDSPDLGGALPAVFNQYDFTYQHLFSNGFAMRVTPFIKEGTNIPSFALIKSLSTGSFVFQTNNQGINKTSGIEFGLNTPDHPYGFAGFLSATYQNVIASAPPLGIGEDALPINGSGSLTLGDTFRAGYVSPLSFRIGGAYKTHNGLRIAPVLQYDRGFPYNVGNLIASSQPINGSFANIQQVNFGVGTTQIPGFQFQAGPSNATNYYDPSFSGNSLAPNIAATRGTPSSPSSGGVLWTPNLSANLVLEYKIRRSTFGVQFTNLFGNAFNGTIPVINPYYQPVANGLSGPQTGVNPNAGIANGAFVNVPKDAFAFVNGAYLLLPNRPMTTTVYYQLGF